MNVRGDVNVGPDFVLLYPLFFIKYGKVSWFYVYFLKEEKNNQKLL